MLFENFKIVWYIGEESYTYRYIESIDISSDNKTNRELRESRE